MAGADKIFENLTAQLSLLDNLFRDSLDVLREDIKDMLAAGASQKRINGHIGKTMADLARDFSEAYDAIAEQLIDDMLRRGVGADSIPAKALDALDDLRDSNAARIRQVGDVLAESVSSHIKRAEFPGLSNADMLDADMAAISDDLIVTMSRDGQTFTRVASEVAVGGIVEQAGELTRAETDEWVYEYQGPEDDRNRPHCALYVGKKLTRAEVDAISPEQMFLAGDDPAAPLWRPYYSEASACRHNWVLVSKE